MICVVRTLALANDGDGLDASTADTLGILNCPNLLWPGAARDFPSLFLDGDRNLGAGFRGDDRLSARPRGWHPSVCSLQGTSPDGRCHLFRGRVDIFRVARLLLRHMAGGVSGRRRRGNFSTRSACSDCRHDLRQLLHGVRILVDRTAGQNSMKPELDSDGARAISWVQSFAMLPSLLSGRLCLLR